MALKAREEKIFNEGEPPKGFSKIEKEKQSGGKYIGGVSEGYLAQWTLLPPHPQYQEHLHGKGLQRCFGVS